MSYKDESILAKSVLCVWCLDTEPNAGVYNKYTTVSVKCSGAAHAELKKPKRVLVLYDQVSRAISTG